MAAATNVFLNAMVKIPLFGLFALVYLSPGLHGQTPPTIKTVAIDNAGYERICLAFQTKLDEVLLTTKLAGATVGLALPDGRSCSAAAGISDLETKRTLLKTDPILAGSIGKTFVSAFALQLVQAGDLNL